MTRIPSHLLGAAALSLCLATPIAVAQQGPDAATEEAAVQDEIVVIGQYLYSDQVNALKTPTPIIDVPQSLSIIGADQIVEQGFTSIGDVINYVPGVNVSQGEGHRDSVVFRGVRSTADFFVDGVRDDVQYYRPLYNLEQVEILRGPNALLFGRGGTGGILNRVTKKGVVGESFTGYKASIDTFGEFDAQIDHNFSINEDAAFRINAFYEGLDNHRDFYEGDRFGINPTATVEIGPDTVVNVSFEYNDFERFIDRGIPTGANGEPVEAFEDIIFGDPGLNTSEFEAHILRASLQHNFSDTLKGNVTASFGDYDKLYQNFYASGYDETNTPNEVTLDGYVDTTQRETFTLAGNLVGEFQTGTIGHTLIAGAEFIDTQNDNDRFNPVFSTSGTDKETFLIQNPLDFTGGVGTAIIGGVATPTSMTFSDPNDANASEVSVYSFYIQDQIEVSPQFDIVLGARFDSFDQSTTNLLTSETAERTDEEISPRLGLIYKPQENVSIYASYSETFLPSSGEQFASTGSLDPDVFENAEIGVKWDFVQGLSLTAAYFQNEQTTSERDPVTEDEFETRGLEVEGFEVQVQGQITDALAISAGYSYLEGETDGGAELPRELPENTFSVWGTYQATDKLGFGLGATYQDESFITDFDIGNDASIHPTLPAYTRIDAAAFYDLSETLRVQLNLENLTDETYFPSSHSTHQATVGAPLNARITISGRF